MFTEPHYLRQAQRYLGHATRTMRTGQVPITPASLIAHLIPARLDATARRLDPDRAQAVHEYLDALTERRRRDLAGVRDRLSILAESDLAQWLRPEDGTLAIDLPAVAKDGDVAYVALEADRWPLLAHLLGAAIIGDLITVTAELQATPRPTLVLVDGSRRSPAARSHGCSRAGAPPG